ncbi:dTDP-4-dehydrorhamnose 3,5-epimerase [Novosphingobium lentum]|uniref:dTDP-4-dehydrorhamnose 3,5-epimerase n=1 Tax=Novosphingobium lentum TaxID=145287 RepID=UPI00082F6757|nr:dTDP-4-dehydrorhamnose 3,5-epimerase [Novosphingobium lentum]
MEFRRFDLPGPIEIIPSRFGDDRGYFSETFRDDRFREEVGPIGFVQDNQSLSTRAGTIRGLHFQTHPFAQGKLVRCIAGSMFDVAVDLRRDSPGYGKWVAATLSNATGNQLWIPAGFGHGFCTLEPDTVVSYKVTAYYSRDDDRGLAWDDPDIAVVWPDVASPDSLSPKDRAQPAFRDLPACFSTKD